MKKKIGFATIAVAIAVYLFVVILLIDLGSEALIFGVIYAGVCMFVAHLCYTSALAEQVKDTNTFRKNFPMNPFGQTMNSFQHVFFSDDKIIDEVRERVSSSVNRQTPLPQLSQILLRDEDRSLVTPEARLFFKSTGPENLRGSAVTLFVYTGHFGRMQSLSWWILASGYIDASKLFNFIVYAPIRLPFWIIPYARRTFDIMLQVRTVHEAFYNNVDIFTEVRSLQKIVFDTLVEVLDEHGVDTSDLKAQRGQVMNINVSGGRTHIGQVMQGTIARMTQQPVQQGSKAP